MWNAVELDMLPGRVRAVSVPDQRQMLLVWTTDGLYGVWFTRSATTLRMGSAADAERAFNSNTGLLTWKDLAFAMYGECGAPGKRYGGDLPDATPQGDKLAFDAKGRLAGVDTAEGTRVAIEDPPRPGKWFVAGFSADGRYLLVADEWNVRLLRYLPPKGGAARKPSGDQVALLRAIAAEPDDDTARLVYADWLADNGEADRGEFIRLQCSHAKCLRTNKLFAHDERVQKLLSLYGDIWETDYPAIRGVRWSGFWRGFPGVTASSAGTLAKNADAIWDAAPVESVVVEKLDLKGATALAKCPQLSRIRVLDIKSFPPRGSDNEAARTLLASPALSGLWWLAFTGCSHLDQEVLGWIAASGSLRNLEVLTLRFCGVGDEGARALAASPHLNKLRDLDLTGSEFTGDTPSVLRKRFPDVRF